MQTDNPILDDLAKLATGAAGTLHGMKKEIEAAIRARVDRLASEMNMVPREEFEVVRDMARKARQENEELKKRIEKLEGRAPAGSKPGGKPVKAARKKTGKKKK